MLRLSAEQRRFLVTATESYRSALPGSPADEYLAIRGLAAPSRRSVVDKFQLGYVAEPLPGHEMYEGMLAIPYIRPAQDGQPLVVKLRFRNLGEGTKYLDVAGTTTRLYNTAALVRDTINICLTEGEIDTITAEMCGFPAVGVPGAENWKPHFVEPFLGYNKVFVLADGDEPGMKFARKVCQSLPNGVIIPAPDREDVNSTVLKLGPGYYQERLK